MHVYRLEYTAIEVVMLSVGYRHIGLRSEFNQPQGVATLFVHIQVKDYIIDAFAGDFHLFYFLGFRRACYEFLNLSSALCCY